MTRKELAQKIGTSASFLTQLYRGSKLLNLTTIAKLEKALGITFTIKAEIETELEGRIDFPHSLQSLQSDLPVNKLNSLPGKKKKRVQPQMAQEPKINYQRKKFVKK